MAAAATATTPSSFPLPTSVDEMEAKSIEVGLNGKQFEKHMKEKEIRYMEIRQEVTSMGGVYLRAFYKIDQTFYFFRYLAKENSCHFVRAFNYFQEHGFTRKYYFPHSPQTNEKLKYMVESCDAKYNTVYRFRLVTEV